MASSEASSCGATLLGGVCVAGALALLLRGDHHDWRFPVSSLALRQSGFHPGEGDQKSRASENCHGAL